MSGTISSEIDFLKHSEVYNPQWKKCLLIALLFHLAVLAIPVSKLAGDYNKNGSEIEVAVIPAPVELVQKAKPDVQKPVQPPKVQKIKSSPPARPEGKKTEEPPQKVVSPDLNPVRETANVGPGSGGVAIVGGSGTGATLSGSAGEPGGSGTGLGKKGVGGGAGGTVPIDTSFGAGDGPRWVYQERPIYPYAAQRLGKKGRVVVRLTIDEKGNLLKADVIEATDQIFVSAVLDAVRRSKFSPARKNGVPFTSRVIWPVSFSLGESS